MVGRAGMTHLWVLIEHPDPWPASAPDDILPVALTEKSTQRRAVSVSW
ncbi:hypothetical protein ACETU7_29325 [Rhodococcus sp. 3Y1]